MLLALLGILGPLPSALGQDSSSVVVNPVEHNKEIYRAYIDQVYNVGDLGALDTLVVSNLVNNGLMLGRDSLRSSITELRTGFPDLNVEIEDLLGEGDRVAARMTLVGTHRGPYAGIPATKRRVRVPIITISRLKNGVIAQRWIIIDWADLFHQLGR